MRPAKRMPRRSSRRRAVRRTRHGRSTSWSGVIRCWSSASCCGAANCSRRRIARLSGKPDELRDATRSQRQALAAATQAAIAVLGDDATEAYRTQIAATLQAASVDEETAGGLQQGRLTREVSGSTGFPDAVSLSIAPTPKSKGTSRRPRVRNMRRQAGDASVTGPPRTRGSGAGFRRGVAAQRGGRDHRPPRKSAEAANARVDNLRDELDTARQEARAAADGGPGCSPRGEGACEDGRSPPCSEGKGVVMETRDVLIDAFERIRGVSRTARSKGSPPRSGLPARPRRELDRVAGLAPDEDPGRPRRRRRRDRADLDISRLVRALRLAVPGVGHRVRVLERRRRRGAGGLGRPARRLLRRGPRAHDQLRPDVDAARPRPDRRRVVGSAGDRSASAS